MKDENTETKIMKFEEMQAQLKNLMVKGMSYCLDSLFSHAQSAIRRIDEINKIISKLDEDLLDVDKIKELSPKEMMTLRNLLSKSQDESLAFLLKLRSAFPTALENLKTLESLKMEIEHEQNRERKEDRAVNQELRAVLLEEIKRRIEAREQQGKAVPVEATGEMN